MQNLSGSIVATISAEMGAVLSRSPVDATDDFFLCGGDSVLAVTLVIRLLDRFAPPSSEAADRFREELLTGVFDDATPAALAAVVERAAR